MAFSIFRMGAWQILKINLICVQLLEITTTISSCDRWDLRFKDSTMETDRLGVASCCLFLLNIFANTLK